MSNRSWTGSFRQKLRTLQKADQPVRVAIVGIGHDLRGDDGAGTAVARALDMLATRQYSLDTAGPGTPMSRVLIIDAGPAPENYTGPLRRFGPDLVLLVDAAEMDTVPGTVRWLRWQEITGLGAVTHTLPLHVFASYVSAELDCEVALIGIQPNTTEIGAVLSPKVQKAVGNVVKVLAGELTRSFASSDNASA